MPHREEHTDTVNPWPLIWMPIAIIVGGAVGLFVIWLIIAAIGLGAVSTFRGSGGDRPDLDHIDPR
jgi:hypothetical protein